MSNATQGRQNPNCYFFWNKGYSDLNSNGINGWFVDLWIKASVTLISQTSFPGGNSEREPPDPISNSEVKTFSADGSVGSPHVRVGHHQDLFMKSRCRKVAAFFVSSICSVLIMLPWMEFSVWWIITSGWITVRSTTFDLYFVMLEIQGLDVSPVDVSITWWHDFLGYGSSRWTDFWTVPSRGAKCS